MHPQTTVIMLLARLARSTSTSPLLLALLTSAAAAAGGGPGPPSAKFDNSGWRCCAGISSCDAWNATSCPADADLHNSSCSGQRNCTGPCGGLWCEEPREDCATAGGELGGGGGGDLSGCAPSEFDDPTLRQLLRPPRVTALQAQALKEISGKAAPQSAAAKSWVLGYLASPKVRGNLHPSLQQLSAAKLLEMFTVRQRSCIATVFGSFSLPFLAVHATGVVCS